MPARVHYHHPEDRQFSLDFVNPELDRIGQRAVDYDPHVSLKVEQYDLDRTVYVVYTSAGGSGRAADAVEEEHFDEIEAMDPANSAIATRYLGVFETVLAENDEEDERVAAYKDVDVEAIANALDRVDWDGTATEVAGRLASNLVLKHPLPNANHRTAIGLVQLYLRRIDPAFSMPATSREVGDDESDWTDWVDDHIEQSKRLLTVRRNGKKFHYLQQWGCDVIERKHGVEIQLAEYDLDLAPSERWQRYAEEHEELWIQFVGEAVERASTQELRERSGLSKHALAEELRQLE